MGDCFACNPSVMVSGVWVRWVILSRIYKSFCANDGMDWRTPGCKTCQDVRHHKGWHSRVLPATVPDTMKFVATQKRFLDTCADDAGDNHESKRHKSFDDIVPMAQEPLSGFGVKLLNLEAIRRADALKRANCKRSDEQ